MSIIISMASFILALGILVTVHEFGHFWVARKCGVKVLRFSVGFGKPLIKFKRKNDETEYVIASIPLGGYVKMLDEREGNVEESEKKLAFNNKPLLSRFLIVLAGPVFNLVFAFLVFWLILTVGERGLKPVVGKLDPAGVAIHSGIEVGDEILAVNDRPATIWRVAIGLIASEMIDNGSVDLTVETPGGQTKDIQFNVQSGDIPEPNDIFNKLGIEPFLPTLKPMIGNIVSAEPADLAGLKRGDLILSANNEEVDSWQQWVSVIRANPEKSISIIVLRNNERLALRLIPQKIIENDSPIGRIGVSPWVDEVSNDFYTTYSLWFFSDSRSGHSNGSLFNINC